MAYINLPYPPFKPEPPALISLAQAQANPNIVIALAGNKIDLVQPSSSSSNSESSENEEEADDATATPGENGAETGENLRQVPRDEAEAYAQEAGLLFFETSAKTGEGVQEIFTAIGRLIHATG